MPDAGTAFDGSVWVASTSAVGLGTTIVIFSKLHECIATLSGFNFVGQTAVFS